MLRLRLLAALAASVLSTPAHAGPAPEAAPAPPSPGATGGVNVIPAPDSTYRSPDRQYVVLGTVRPGTLLGDTVLVRNLSDRPQEVLVYPADALTAVGGGYGYTKRTDPRKGVGSWIRLSASRLQLPARGSSRIRFTVKVPATVAGGGYIGGIVAEPAATPTGAFSTVTRFAMAVTLTVPGGTPGAMPGLGNPNGRFELTDVDLRPDGDKVCPVVRYRNGSQDVLDPVFEVSADGPFARKRVSKQSGVGAVEPEGSHEARLRCVDRPLGPGRVEVRASTPRGDGARAASAFWLPIPLVIALLWLLLLIAALVRTWLRRRRRARIAADAPGTSSK